MSVEIPVRDDQGNRQGCNEAKPSATPAIVKALAQAPSGRQYVADDEPAAPMGLTDNWVHGAVS